MFILMTAMVFLLEHCKHMPTEEVLPIVPNSNNPNNPYIPPTPPRDTICFSSDILPLIISTCAKPGCHTQLNSYASVMSNGIVRAGNATGSQLYYYAKNGSSQMHSGAQTLVKLDTASLSKIAKWISQGAINSICNNCDTVNVKFSTHIQPLITKNCLGCHTSSGTTLLTNYAQIKTTVTNGKFYCVINQTNGCLPMPQGGAKLSSCQIRAVKMWIDAGALNN